MGLHIFSCSTCEPVNICLPSLKVMARLYYALLSMHQLLLQLIGQSVGYILHTAVPKTVIPKDAATLDSLTLTLTL